MKRIASISLGALVLSSLAFAGGYITQKNGLKYKIVKTGKGRKATRGRLCTLHYRGRLANGKQFDSSYKRRRPFVFRLGAGQVIKGWEAGINGMIEGEKRRLIIPPHLGYGKQANGKIPASSTLVFDIHLLSVR